MLAARGGRRSPLRFDSQSGQRAARDYRGINRQIEKLKQPPQEEQDPSQNSYGGVMAKGKQQYTLPIA